MNIRHTQEELYPRIFHHAESLFPEFAFRRNARGFVATDGASFDGTLGKAQGKINYLETSPAVLFDNRAGLTRNVIKYVQERERFSTYIEALRFCSHHVGMPLADDSFVNVPMEEFHTLEQEHRKRQAFEEVQHLFVQHLWEGKNNRALAYLRKRGYTDDDIRAMNAGCTLPFSHVQQYLRSRSFDDETIQLLGLQSAVPDRIKPDVWYRIGETFSVSFPIRDAVGRMLGFIIRADEVLTDDAGKDRFPKYVFTKNLSKTVPVGFNHTLANTHVVAVEGVIDALFLQARGFHNVIGVGGKHLTDDQFQTLERYNIRSLTFAFDNDVEGMRGTAATIEKLRRTHSQQIHPHSSKKIYVCTASAFRTAKDPDEFVRRFGNEAFQQLIDTHVETAEMFMARYIAEEQGLVAESSEENHLSPKVRDAALERVWSYAKYLQTPVELHDFTSEFYRQTGLPEDVISNLGEQAQAYFRKENERRNIQKALQKAEEQLRNGTEISLIREHLQQSIVSIGEPREAARPYSISTFLEEICAMPDGLRTGYPELDENIRLSQNGVTIIAARPSHGKTSFKMNLLLNLLEQYPDRTFCFFSYEEPVKIITLKLLNILAGVRFQGQQLPDLVQYLRHSYDFSKATNNNALNKATLNEKNAIAHIEAVDVAQAKLAQYLESGRLVLSGERTPPETIRATVENLRQQKIVGGVFIDYVQKVKPASGKFATRQLELQEVSSQLHGIAVDMRAPMIVGAQFNREVRTESDVREDCLREAGDLEQDANLVLALWNPAKNNDDESSFSASNLDMRRVELKVKTLKNRDGAVNLKGVSLVYDMPLSTIRSSRQI